MPLSEEFLIRQFNETIVNGYPPAIETPSGLIPHVIRDHQGRIIRAYASVWGQRRSDGSGVPSDVSLRIRRNGYDCDAAGHIIPKCWGGSGCHIDNLFPQNATVNSGLAFVDGDFARHLDASSANFIIVDMHFFYEDPSKPNRPSEYGGYVREGFRVMEGTPQDILAPNPIVYVDRNRTISNNRLHNQMVTTVMDAASKAVKVGTAVKTSTQLLKTAGTIGKGAGNISKVLKPVSTIALPVAIGIDVVRMGTAIASGDGKQVLKTTAKVGTEWGAMAYGAAIGSIGGPVGTALGAGIGAVAGAIISSFY